MGGERDEREVDKEGDRKGERKRTWLAFRRNRIPKEIRLGC